MARQARLVGLNHVAIEVADLETALSLVRRSLALAIALDELDE